MMYGKYCSAKHCMFGNTFRDVDEDEDEDEDNGGGGGGDRLGRCKNGLN